MLVFIIAIYKRPELTKIVLDYYRKKQKQYGFKVVIAGSEGQKSKAMARGFDYIEVENFPLSNKNNAMMQRAAKHNPDAVVLLGSDDFICDNVIQFYYELIKQKEQNVVGFYDLYFYSTQHEYLSHYDVGGKSYGAGRFFPRVVLDKIKFTGWTGKYDRGLDANNMKVLDRNGIGHRTVMLADINGLLVDVKHNFNISHKNITFVGTRVNKYIMAKKKIPVEKIDKLEIEKEVVPMPEVSDTDIITFVSNGKSRYLKEGEIEVTGFEAKLFTQRGYGKVKS